MSPKPLHQIETLSDCRRLVQPSAPSPLPSEYRSGEPSPGPRYHLLGSRTVDPGRLPQIVDPAEDAPPPPLDTTDPRMQAYFADLKKRITAVWSYPAEAIQKQQSGKGVVVFLLRRNGSVGEVKVVHSTGSDILDRYLANAIRLAAPFPSIPCQVTEEAIPISIGFSYSLPGASATVPPEP